MEDMDAELGRAQHFAPALAPWRPQLPPPPRNAPVPPPDLSGEQLGFARARAQFAGDTLWEAWSAKDRGWGFKEIKVPKLVYTDAGSLLRVEAVTRLVPMNPSEGRRAADAKANACQQRQQAAAAKVEKAKAAAADSIKVLHEAQTRTQSVHIS